MEKIALLLIDLQKDFFVGTSVASKENKKILPSVIKLLQECRKNKIPIVHLRWMLHRNVDTMPLRRKERKVTDWCRNKDGWGPVVPELEVKGGELLIEKSTYSGFYETMLDSMLKRLGVKMLIIVGIYSSMCVFATALDAVYKNYKVIIPIECVLSSRPEFNEEYLKNLDENVGRVLELEKVLAML